MKHYHVDVGEIPRLGEVDYHCYDFDEVVGGGRHKTFVAARRDYHACLHHMIQECHRALDDVAEDRMDRGEVIK